MSEDGPTKSRGVVLSPDVVELLEREMVRDHRPSLTNMAEALIREACDVRLMQRGTQCRPLTHQERSDLADQLGVRYEDGKEAESDA